MSSVAASPEWAIARRDDLDELGDGVLDGSWKSRVVNATRGLPHTDFGHREIAVPAGDHPTAKVVRMHELVHATISPMSLDAEIIDKMGLSSSSVALAEELRVNHVLARSAFEFGVDMKAMKDGTELRDARMAVASDNFPQVIALVCSTMFTGSERSVATELQRKFPELRDIRKRIKRYLSKVSDWQLTTTRVASVQAFVETSDDGTETIREVRLPDGFSEVTLPLAQFIEGLLAKDGAGASSPEGFRKQLNEQKDTPLGNEQGWASLRFGVVPLQGDGLGFLSRSKKASSMGRAPRRLHRLLTDPERRVFDRVSRRSGGVVLVDGSGSMSLTSDDLRALVQAAPGCRVAVYSYQRGRPNIWVVADRGKYALAEHFPAIGHDNCVDLPALKWAVRQRVNPRDPVLWVSDGQVTGVGCGFTHSLALQTVVHNKRHRVAQVRNVEEAVEALRDLSRGKGLDLAPKGVLKYTMGYLPEPSAEDDD